MWSFIPKSQRVNNLQSPRCKAVVLELTFSHKNFRQDSRFISIRSDSKPIYRNLGSLGRIIEIDLKTAHLLSAEELFPQIAIGIYYVPHSELSCQFPFKLSPMARLLHLVKHVLHGPHSTNSHSFQLLLYLWR